MRADVIVLEATEADLITYRTPTPVDKEACLFIRSSGGLFINVVLPEDPAEAISWLNELQGKVTVLKELIREDAKPKGERSDET